MKRKDYLNWDQYFMGVAQLSGLRSKDPGTQVGCCIATKENRIASLGYNGLPDGCSDDEFPWDRGDSSCMTDLNTKYPYVVHSELNAILNFVGPSLHGCKMYVTLFPCNECAKAIIQSGIEEVIYWEDKYAHTDSVKASKRMFAAAGVNTRQYVPANTKIEIKI